ncbi:hypothetical protein ST201phi2-1p415 [Pseudomonas phage 201phi2-1]|uniref:Uncharacterized protein n=1 Tax=Pseudomonas phage 201phi2-1 TaxID=198110 RepID=B3FJS4_BP201|nr:hypothetical protein ST201phi2-1p415 [Pseudomonas phage 201phi2-1]ABY63239.1 hypothetical protein 201phi2-1p415 [Pseudomonas phage 201phi2-1]
MSFFVCKRDDIIHFGGMQSVMMDWEHVPTFGTFSVVMNDCRLMSPDDIWVWVGSSVITGYIKGRFVNTGLWTEQEICRLSYDNKALIIIREGKNYFIYKNGHKEFRTEVSDGSLMYTHGCVEGQVLDAIDRDIMPTRWVIDKRKV